MGDEEDSEYEYSDDEDNKIAPKDAEGNVLMGDCETGAAGA
jgi:hypothetical protein